MRSGRCCPHGGTHLPAPALATPSRLHKRPKFSSGGGRLRLLTLACVHSSASNTHPHRTQFIRERQISKQALSLVVCFFSAAAAAADDDDDEQRGLACRTGCCGRSSALLLFVECHGTRLEWSHSVTMRQEIANAFLFCFFCFDSVDISNLLCCPCAPRLCVQHLLCLKLVKLYKWHLYDSVIIICLSI